MAKRLEGIKNIELLYKHPFFKEFTIKCPIPPEKIIAKMRDEKIFAGIDLGRFDYGVEDGLLIAVTEKRTKEEMDRYVEVLTKIVS